MKNTIRSVCAAAILAAGSLLAASGAIAAGPSAGAASQYRAERAVCGKNQQDTSACIREAGAAAQAARQGALVSASAETYTRNALQRCQLHPPEDRIACQDRVLGTGMTTIDGSVMGGGAIRETATPVPAPATLN